MLMERRTSMALDGTLITAEHVDDSDEQTAAIADGCSEGARPAGRINRDVVCPILSSVGVVQVLGPNQVLRNVLPAVGCRLGPDGRVQLQPERGAPPRVSVARHEPDARQLLRLRQHAHDEVQLRLIVGLPRVAVGPQAAVVDVLIQPVDAPAVPRRVEHRQREALEVASDVP
eukprot:1769004-Rhodomonas_salina.1